MELNIGQRLALNIDAHTALDAGAGTGKTQSITGRAIEHMLSIDQRATRLLPPGPRPGPLPAGALQIGLAEREDLSQWPGLLPSEVVILTFTNRAADQMRHRLWRELDRLRPGPTADDGIIRHDPRVTVEGLVDQFKAMLDDAPIGTIDSFLSRLVSPWRAALMEAPTEDVISGPRRVSLAEESLDLAWRIRGTNDALAAGIRGDWAARFTPARDRLTRRFGNRKRVRKALKAMSSNRVFVDSFARAVDARNGEVTPESLRARILELIAPMDDVLVQFCNEIRDAQENWLDVVRTNAAHLDLATGLQGATRIATLDHLNRTGAPTEMWSRLLWVHACMRATISESSLLKSAASVFPNDSLPNDPDWPRGIATFTSIPQASRAAEKASAKEVQTHLRALWGSALGRRIRSLAHAIYCLDPGEGIPHRDGAAPPLVTRMVEPLPFNAPGGLLTFDLATEAAALSDMLVVHRGLDDILRARRIAEGTHEHDDISDLAADLLLAQCPRIMRGRYPAEVERRLDDVPAEAWRDDHVYGALTHFTELIEAGGGETGLSVTELEALQADLAERLARVKEIRARYRAFIIDEAQDNSARQWRLMHRLWGERALPEGWSRIEAEWQPTVCCVGDRKQSIYAFRQAEVAGFVDFIETLRRINREEYLNLTALTRAPSLRDTEAARDPRYVNQGAFRTAGEFATKLSVAEEAWVSFAIDENGDTYSADEVLARREGHVELVVNYRTHGALLEAMNDWWVDIFSPRHNRFEGDWYADPQSLIPHHAHAEGHLEWLLPGPREVTTDPPEELTTPLDPFEVGDVKQQENALIASRIQSLVLGTPVQVGETELPAEAPVRPRDILVLLPSRGNVVDMMRRLDGAGIPAVAEKESGLLERPVVQPLLALLRACARPDRAQGVADLARSCLVGLSDAALDALLVGARESNDHFALLATRAPTPALRRLLRKWVAAAAGGRIVEMLDSVLDHSDLLVAYPGQTARRQAEQFVRLVAEMMQDSGGDPVLLSDTLDHLKGFVGRELPTASNLGADAVRVMTIHAAKGLESKVVILSGLFRAAQGTLQHENRARILTTPQLIAGNPAPWADGTKVDSPIWRITSHIQAAKVQAEARRLFYVACTRVEERLILAGGCGRPHYEPETDLIHLTLPGKELKVFGEMWLEALAQGAERCGDDTAPWGGSTKTRTFSPTALLGDPHLRPGTLSALPVLYAPESFGTQAPSHPPLVRMSRLDEAANLALEVRPAPVEEVPVLTRRMRLAPHRLDAARGCRRRHWLQSHLGLDGERIELPFSGGSAEVDASGIPVANVLGSIIHRQVEVGLANPGRADLAGRGSLPTMWVAAAPDLLTDAATLESVLDEMLPADANREATLGIMQQLGQAVRAGPVGILGADGTWCGEKLDGLRTEQPFALSLTVPVDEMLHRFTAHGQDPLAAVEEVTFDFAGIADLVLATHVEADPANGRIRAIDLKTTDARMLHRGALTALTDVDADAPRTTAEAELLEHYRMQLALYTRALIDTEGKRDKPREVMPPAILVATTGRLIEMTPEESDAAQQELEELLADLARLAIRGADDAEQFPRLEGEAAEACKTCPFALGDIRICAPAGEPLGAVSDLSA